MPYLVTVVPPTTSSVSSTTTFSVEPYAFVTFSRALLLSDVPTVPTEKTEVLLHGDVAPVVVCPSVPWG